jgi:hypothetical protein
MRVAAALCLAVAAAPAPAHDLVTADAAQGYLARQALLGKTIAGGGGAPERARALVEMGRMLDGIRELFNRDIEAHGEVQGLPSNFLLSELRMRGTGLEWSPSQGRFLANLRYYREALALDPGPAIAAEASFRLLQGGFYDSFTDDPLAPASRAPDPLAESIRLGETFLARYPQHAGREEATFILAVRYMQASLGTEREEARDHARKARALAAGYGRDYPGSLRTVTLDALLERIPLP